jgi:hypothetical protein
MEQQKTTLLRRIERAEMTTSARLSGIAFIGTVGFFVAAPFAGAAALGYLGFTQAAGLGVMAKTALTAVAAVGGLCLGAAPLYALRSSKETPTSTLELMTIPAAAVDKGVSKIFAPLKRLCLSARFNRPAHQQPLQPPAQPDAAPNAKDTKPPAPK